MPRILVTNDDGYRSEGIHALADALRALGEVTIVAPVAGSERDRPRAHAAASAAARGDRRSRVRGGRHADRLREHRRHAGLQGPAGSGRVRDQQGVEPRRRRHLLGDGGRARSKGRCSAFPRIAVSLRQTREALRLQLRGARGGGDGRRAAAAAAAGADVSQHQRAERASRRAIRVTVQAKRNHVTSVAERHDPKGRRVLLDRGRPERLGAARSVGLSGGARRLRLGDAAASRPDGASRARGGRGVVVRAGSRSPVARVRSDPAEVAMRHRSRVIRTCSARPRWSRWRRRRSAHRRGAVGGVPDVELWRARL